MNRHPFFLTLLILPLAASPGVAQGDLGNYYQNMYLQTHLAMDLTKAAGASATTRRTAPVTMNWANRPQESALIRQIVAGSPANQRAQVQTTLVQLMQAMPTIMAEVSKQTGVPLKATNAADVCAVASVLAYQELVGKQLTNRQFDGEVRATRDNYRKPGVTQADIQNSGEKYAMCIAWLVVLKAANQPKALRDFAAQTFRLAYRGNHTEFTSTEDRGMVRK